MNSNPNANDTSDVEIAFVGGWGRSGSTLLSRMLAEVDSFVCVGEIRDVFLRGLIENRVCGCGQRFVECEFWSKVGEEAYGGWDQLSIPMLEDLRNRTDKPWHVPALMKAGLRKDTDEAVAAYGDILLPLYRAMRTVTGARVIVDASKIASFGAILNRTEGLSPRFIHLVRDPRGSLHSWMKQIRMEDDPDTTRYMPQYSVADGAARYVGYNTEMHAVEANSPHMLMKYEDLVVDPEAQIRKALQTIGVSADSDLSHFIGPEGVKLGVTHTVIGNPMRHQSGWIPLRPDEAWREKMPSRQQKTITALTLPLMKKYGYDIRSSW